MRRGDVFRLRLGGRHGHEQSGVRYGVIVRSDALMRLSTVLTAPISTVARPASFRPEVDIDGSVTRVLVEQTGAIDVSRLGDHHGHLSVEEQWGVDLALEMVLDLQWATPACPPPACGGSCWSPRDVRAVGGLPRVTRERTATTRNRAGR